MDTIILKTNGVDVIVNRNILFEQADIIAKKMLYAKSDTGMYVCKTYDQFLGNGVYEGLIEKLNVCAICLFIEDDPDNYGDIIEPTSYDGDCDDCNCESRYYSTMINEGDVNESD